MPSQSWTSAGHYTWNVPSDATQLTVTVIGAGGNRNNSDSGHGGRVTGIIPIDGTETFEVYVGGVGELSNTGYDAGTGGGFNGGGNGGGGDYSGGGGGASDIRLGGTALSDRIIVGGGGGADNANGEGHGGYPSGVDGTDSNDAATGGTGGTQNSGGSGGNPAGGGNATAGTDGSLGQGGDGGDGAYEPGGGGGGGYYGGGGGGGSSTTWGDGSGGGGGSSYYDPGLFQDVETETGVPSSSDSDGEVLIEWTLPPAAPSGLTTSQENGQIRLDWTDNATDEDEYHVFREGTSGVDTTSTQVATLAAGTTTWLDTGSGQGEDYYYRVYAWNSGGGYSNPSSEVHEFIPLPAPSQPTFPTVGSGSVDVSWSATHNNGSTEVQYRRRNTASPNPWTTDATVANTTESHTITGLLNGEEHDVRIVATAEDDTAAGAANTFTTTLPDEDQPVLLNGVEDEITVDRESSVSNYGDVRIQQREAGASTWGSTATGWAEQVVSYDTLTATFVGLEDGEEYEYRARTETEHVQGDWTTSVSILTKFPGATALQATSVSATTISLSWTDNADNEDGQEVIRERRVDGEWWPEEIVEDVGPDTESYTDDSDAIHPNTTYRYRIRPYTEHTTADSNTVTVTTDSEGVPRRTVPAGGWYVEVDHPTAAAPLTPTVLDSVEFPHQVNALPEISVPIRKSERWLADQQLEEAPMRVWKDGKRLPIELLDNVRERPDRVILEGSGGQALTRRVQAEFIEEPAHKGAGIVIDQTGLAHNIDDPQTTTTTDDRMQSADTTTEWLDRLAGTAQPEDVVTVENGVLTTDQTAWFVEAEDVDDTFNTNEVLDTQSPTWSGHRYLEVIDPWFNQWTRIEHTFALGHAIPDGDAAVGARFQIPNTGNHGFNFFVDGVEIESIPADAFTDNDPAPDWYEIRGLNLGGLSAGEHTLLIEFDEESANDGRVYFDCLCIWDDRYPPGFTNDVTSGTLTGPDLHPDGVEQEMVDAITFLSVVAGELTSSWNNLSGDQAVAISNDLGQTWHEAENSDTVEAEFAEGTAQIRTRFRLSGFDDDPGTSPAGRKQAHEVDLYDLYADLNDQPLLINKTYSGKGIEVLQNIAGDHSIFALEWDDELGEQVVEWTQPGLRTREAVVSLTDYESAKVHEDSYDRVVIRGQAKSVEEELVYPNDTEPLDHAPVVEGTGRVYDPSTGTVYQEDADYELNRLDGEITILSTGDMVSGEEYAIDYEWKVSGSYPVLNVPDNAKTFEREVPSIPTSRGCEQAALYLFRKVDEPLLEAEATLTNVDPRQSIVETIGIEGLPTGGQRVEVRESKGSDRKPKLRLGNRKSAEDEFAEIRSQLQAVSRRV